MPFIGMTALSPAVSADQIRRLQQGTIELMVSGVRKPLASVAVLVEHLNRLGVASPAALSLSPRMPMRSSDREQTPRNSSPIHGRHQRALRAARDDDVRHRGRQCARDLIRTQLSTSDQVQGRTFRDPHYCATAALSRWNGGNCTHSRRASFGKASPTTNVLNASVCWWATKAASSANSS